MAPDNTKTIVTEVIKHLAGKHDKLGRVRKIKHRSIDQDLSQHDKKDLLSVVYTTGGEGSSAAEIEHNDKVAE